MKGYGMRGCLINESDRVGLNENIDGSPVMRVRLDLNRDRYVLSRLSIVRVLQLGTEGATGAVAV